MKTIALVVSLFMLVFANTTHAATVLGAGIFGEVVSINDSAVVVCRMNHKTEKVDYFNFNLTPDSALSSDIRKNDYVEVMYVVVSTRPDIYRENDILTIERAQRPKQRNMPSLTMVTSGEFWDANAGGEIASMQSRMGVRLGSMRHIHTGATETTYFVSELLYEQYRYVNYTAETSTIRHNLGVSVALAMHTSVIPHVFYESRVGCDITQSVQRFFVTVEPGFTLGSLRFSGYYQLASTTKNKLMPNFGARITLLR